MGKVGSWYKAWRADEEGPLLVMEITEAEAAEDVDVTVRGKNNILADWHIIKPNPASEQGVSYSHRIFYSENVRAKLKLEGGRDMTDGDFNRWQAGRRLEL